MSMISSDKKEKMLNWLENEKNKDRLELLREKNKFIQEIKKNKKEDFFKPTKKLTLWQKIKIMILGN